MSHLIRLPSGHLSRVESGHLGYAGSQVTYSISVNKGAKHGTVNIDGQEYDRGYEWAGTGKVDLEYFEASEWTIPDVGLVYGDGYGLSVSRLHMRSLANGVLFEGMDKLASAKLHVTGYQYWESGDGPLRTLDLFAFHDPLEAAADFWAAGRKVATIPADEWVDEVLDITDADTYWKLKFTDEALGSVGILHFDPGAFVLSDITWE